MILSIAQTAEYLFFSLITLGIKHLAVLLPSALKYLCPAFDCIIYAKNNDTAHLTENALQKEKKKWLLRFMNRWRVSGMAKEKNRYVYQE